MALFDQAEFNKFIVDNNVIGFFDKPYKLKSGRLSHWYVNWRTLCSDVFLVDQLADFIIGFLKDKEIGFDTIYGIPEGASKIALISQYKWSKSNEEYGRGSHTLLMGRGFPKEHGAPKDRFFLGEPAGRIIVLEDVTTTGVSLVEGIRLLEFANAHVVGAIGLTNRMQLREDGKSVEEELNEMNLPYLAMSDASSLLPLAFEKAKPSEKIVSAIKKEFLEFGVKQVEL